jgi:hypothetical protein
VSERRKRGDDLTGRRGGYEELKKELHHFFKRIWLIVIVIGLTSVVGLAGFGYLLRQERNEALARCENQNTRHDNAIYALIAGSNEDQLNQKDSVADEEIRRRRDVTIGLIDALAPKTDCEDPADVKPLPEVTPIPEAP